MIVPLSPALATRARRLLRCMSLFQAHRVDDAELRTRTERSGHAVSIGGCRSNEDDPAVWLASAYKKKGNAARTEWPRRPLGLGHTSATRYLKAAGGKSGINVPPALIDEDSELGRRYIAAMELAGRYAYAGREWVVERVRRIVGGAVTDTVHNHHNYAWRETHEGRDVWVVRKGATPAFPGQRGFVGGSMGDDAVIIE